jgi:hypothetical protein
MRCFKRPLEPYILDLDECEKAAYQNMRISRNTDDKTKKEVDAASI